MAYRSKYKQKKALQTTLGAAPCNSAQKTVDISHLRKPIETSLFGLRQVLRLFETATEEVQNYISYECDIIYECRICRTMFRSLANFILHKREYCKESFNDLSNRDDNFNYESSLQLLNCVKSFSESPEKSEAGEKPEVEPPRKKLADVLLKLESKQRSDEITKEVVKEDLSGETETPGQSNAESAEESVALQEIKDSDAGVFQTLIQDSPKSLDEEKLMKSEVMEIHSILNSDEVILGPDGKIITRPMKVPDRTVPDFNLICSICNQKFSTKKTLTHHIKYKHNNSKVVYQCPESGCKDTAFANSWGVFRHLFKVHRKTPVQVRRMRSQIQSSVIKRGDIADIKKTVPKDLQLEDQNIQWMDNFEGDTDLQMCGGCGKRFERKAALHSHSQICSKRLAVCNSIRESRNPEDSKEKEPPKPVLRGSQKRKPAVSHKSIPLKKTPPATPEKSSPDSENDVIYIDTMMSESENIFEPEMVLIEPLEDPLRHSPDSVVCVSDDDDEVILQQITLEDKAGPYMDTSELKCYSCNYTFKRQENLMRHMASHFKWFRFQCSVCLFKSYDRGSCEYHCKKNHYENFHDNLIVSLRHIDTVKNSVAFHHIRVPQPLQEEDSNSESGDSKASVDKTKIKDPLIQKMIMEVIFGSGVNNETSSRPQRNRVIPKKDDFVYEEDIKRLTDPIKPIKVYPKKRKLIDEVKEQKL